MTTAGLAVFQRLRKRKNDANVFLYAFDLVQLNGHDLRREPVEVRKAALEKLLRPKPDGIRFCEHVEFDDAAMIFEHACLLGCEGIVSKRIGSRYVSGCSRDWIKTKNPTAPAVRREAEEDCAQVAVGGPEPWSWEAGPAAPRGFTTHSIPFVAMDQRPKYEDKRKHAR